jgi:hypothetical protein
MNQIRLNFMLSGGDVIIVVGRFFGLGVQAGEGETVKNQVFCCLFGSFALEKRWFATRGLSNDISF